MRRVSAGAAFALTMCAFAAAAHAADWSATARISTQIQGETNLGVSSGPSREVLSGRTGVNVTIGATTKTSVTRVEVGILGSVSTGARSSNRPAPTLDASHTFRRKDYSVGLTASVRRRPVSDEQIEDTGETISGGTQLTGAFGATLALNIDARNRYSLGASGRFTEFTGAGANLTPTRSLGLSAAWLHQVNRLSSISVSTGVSIFEADGPTGRDSRSVNVSAGFQQQRTSRHRIAASAGLSGVFSDNPTGGTDLRVGATGGASLGYRGGQWNGNLALEQNVSSSNSGQVRQFTRLVSGLDYAINDQERLGVSASYSLRANVGFGGDLRQVVSVGPNYFFSLTKDAALSLGYLFRVAQNEGEAMNTSHRVTLSLTHNLNLLP